MSTVDSFHVDEQQSIYEPLNHIDLENASGQQEGTAETLNRRPHHLPDSVRHRERMSRRLPLEYIRLGNVLKVPDIVARCFGMNKDPHLLLEGQGLNITYVVQALSHIAQNWSTYRRPPKTKLAVSAFMLPGRVLECNGSFSIPLHSCSLTGSTSEMKVSNWGGHLHFREVGE
ncbi:hypothetical protein Tco_0539498 [Tanacetum coccineum]